MSAQTAPAQGAPKVLAFDVFGTVVDWYGSIRSELEQHLPDVDSNAMTLAWRDGYAPAMQAVNASNEWVLLDVLHRRILDSVLADFDQTAVNDDLRQHLTSAWHRLSPWPDSVQGITRLKSQFTVCSMSNGNLGLLSNMAKRGGIPWDCILSAEVFRRYKPDPKTYLGVAEVFAVAPHDVLFVAAHQNDLDSARSCGLRTAFIERPDEYGPVRGNDVSGSASNDWHATSIDDLAQQMGC